jgi:SapC protein
MKGKKLATQLLIYETATPVSHARHGDWSVEVGTDYSFSRGVNSVPLMAVEVLGAAAEYAVVFGGTGDVVMPAVILGLRGEENLYLTEQGGWQAKYIPAFLRRYPFVFSSPDEGKTFTLCIDEGFPGFNKKGRGERLFTAERKPTPYVENVLKFLQQYQVEFRRTQAFCKKLKELNLLEPMRAQINLESGERMFLTGFSAVDRARLKTLSADALASLVKSDELELIYAHLSSMRNFQGMRDRLARIPVSQAVGAEVPASSVSDEPKEERPKASKGAESAKHAGAAPKKR